MSLLQGVDRLMDSRTLATAELALYADELINAWEEMRWLTIYATSIILRENVFNDFSAGMCIYKDMAYLYSISLAFRAIEVDQSNRWGDECVKRFAQYDNIVRAYTDDAEHDPNKWHIRLAAAAEKNCYHRIKEGAAVLDLVTEIEHFFRTQRDLLRLVLFKTVEHSRWG
jgi:hypothetical protein